MISALVLVMKVVVFPILLYGLKALLETRLEKIRRRSKQNLSLILRGKVLHITLEITELLANLLVAFVTMAVITKKGLVMKDTLMVLKFLKMVDLIVIVDLVVMETKVVMVLLSMTVAMTRNKLLGS